MSSEFLRTFKDSWHSDHDSSMVQKDYAAHSFKMVPLARPIFERIWWNLHQKCHGLAFSRLKLPNFHLLWTKITKILGFYAGINKIWPFFSIPLPRLKLPKNIPLARLEARKSTPLRAAHPQVPLQWKNPPPWFLPNPWLFTRAFCFV